LFSGTDTWRNGNFLYGGALWSPRGLDRDGPAFKAVISTGLYRYTRSFDRRVIIGHEQAGQLLAGSRFKTDNTEVRLMFGLDLQYHRLFPDDPGASLRGANAGLRLAFDLWSQVTPTTMFAADGFLSSAGGQALLHLAVGWQLWGNPYIGPEFQIFSCDDYTQARFGVHMTAFKSGPFDVTASAGWAIDSDDVRSVYTRAGIYMRR
jgi:hypothetical protein